MNHSYIKMDGLGNDFVVFDARRSPLALTPAQIRAIADRKTGVGCDQVIVIGDRGIGGSGNRGKNKAPLIPEHLNPRTPDVFMRIYNADGGEVSACGNATRCVAWLLMEESGGDEAIIETKAGMLHCRRAGERRVRVDMGAPKFGWREIPLARECDTGAISPLSLWERVANVSEPGEGPHPLPPQQVRGQHPLPEGEGMAVSMGNPHLVFVVEDVDAVAVGEIGPQLEHHELFPERVNVSFAEIIGPEKIKLRVWERGAGETLACGTAACAALAALHRKGLVASRAEVMLPGGTLEIEWDETSGHIFMTGEVAVSFKGELP